jgi:hypothetical protein
MVAMYGTVLTREGVGRGGGGGEAAKHWTVDTIQYREQGKQFYHTYQRGKAGLLFEGWCEGAGRRAQYWTQYQEQG